MIELNLDFQTGDFNINTNEKFIRENMNYVRLRLALLKILKIVKDVPVKGYYIYVGDDGVVKIQKKGDWPSDKKPPLPFSEQVMNLLVKLETLPEN